MFCHDCGKEIADGIKFCPHCGQSQKISALKRTTDASNSDEAISENISNNQDDTVLDYAPKAKEAIQQVASTVVSSAKSIGEKVNVATDGKVQTYADMARGTATDFVHDVQQVTENKDTDNFFKKNNNRNCKIILGLIAVIIGVFIIFGGNPKYHKEAIKEAEFAASLMKDAPRVDSSKVLFEVDKGTVKGIIVSVNTTNKNKEKITLYYTVVINTNTGQMKAIISGAAKTDDEKEAQIKGIKNSFVKEGYTIK